MYLQARTLACVHILDHALGYNIIILNYIHVHNVHKQHAHMFCTVVT